MDELPLKGGGLVLWGCVVGWLGLFGAEEVLEILVVFVVVLGDLEEGLVQI
jgi:hypothetical protein